MQMVSDVPIGAFLSGGIDSSAVVALHGARTATARSRPTRSASTAARPRAYYNELPYARQVARAASAPSTTRSSCGPTWSALLPRLLWHMDEPIADTAFITTYLVSEFARRDVTVILSGVGGDELFGGYRRYLGDHYQALLRAAAGVAAPGALARSASGCRATGIRRCSTLLRLAKGFLATRRAAVRGALPLLRARSSRDDATRGCCARTATARRDAIAAAFAARRPATTR